MSVNPPFLYDPVKTEGPRSPYKDFDPKAVTRASYEPRASRPKSTGPLISFNQHPDSYLIPPYGKTDAKPMNPSVKTWIKWMRIIQLVLRCFEALCAGGLLAMAIMLKGMDTNTSWIIRIVSAIALVHTVYAIYHLARKASGRTPGSSASYMLFASFFDVAIIPFYAFSALVAMTRQANWTTILPNGDYAVTFSKVVFFLAAIGGGLHVISLAISLYLAVTFRKITELPPDMNPLEDNLTSRHAHKRNKSSMSIATTLSTTEKRLSAPLESKRSSGAAYEDLSRAPTIPFFNTRTQSTDSFSTYKSTPPPSRDSRQDLPSRQYQAFSNSARSSVVDLKRSSGYLPTTPPKRERSSYTEVPLSDSPAPSQFSRSGRGGPVSKISEGWYTADSLSNPRIRSSPGPKKAQYTPLHQSQRQRHDSAEPEEDIFSSIPNPLEANPPTPRHSKLPPSNNSPLSEISTNRRVSGDIADVSPHPGFKAKYYGELKPGTPPIMIRTGNGRQVSSGVDLGDNRGFKVLGKRDVSGKVAEEGRGGNDNTGRWGTRFRKISGLGQ